MQEMHSGHKLLTLAMVSAGLLAGAVTTLALPVLGQIARQTQVSTTAASWVVTITLLASAVFTPVLGRLGDLRGRRRVMLASLALVLIGSFVAAVTTNFAALLLGRLLQGAAGALFALAIGILHDHLRAKRLLSSVAILSSSLGVGGGAALVFAGVLGNGSDYRPVFWFGVVVAATSLGLVATACRATRRDSDRGGSTSSARHCSQSVWSLCWCRCPRPLVGVCSPCARSLAGPARQSS
jgi:MFS family permease